MWPNGHGGSELPPRWESWLEDERVDGERGAGAHIETSRGNGEARDSLELANRQWQSTVADEEVGDREGEAELPGFLGGDEEGVPALLLNTAKRRGMHDGCISERSCGSAMVM